MYMMLIDNLIQNFQPYKPYIIQHDAVKRTRLPSVVCPMVAQHHRPALMTQKLPPPCYKSSRHIHLSSLACPFH